MRLRYRNYRHRIAEGNVSISRTPIENALGKTVAVEEVWSIRGKLYNRTGSAFGMAPIIAAFELAYSRGGGDLVLEHTNGRSSYHALRNRDCIGGTQIAQLPQFPENGGGEYISYRSYTVAVRGIRPVTTGQSMFLEFTESISISGGAARFGCREVNRGPGVRQQLRTHTTCVATQSGSSTLYLGYPKAPPAIWPWALVDEEPDIDATGPQPLSGGIPAYVNRQMSWTYNYQFPTRLYGEPHYLLG